MSYRFKIINGTLPTAEDLCVTCLACFRQIGRQGEQRFCQAGHLELNDPIYQCSEYKDRRTPALSEFHAAAWHLRTEKNGRMMGFIPPQSLSGWDEDNEDNE